MGAVEQGKGKRKRMSVLIKGQKMPKHCWQCIFKDGDDLCILLDADCMRIWGEEKRLPDCPLIELPDHGDLIDKDAALRVVCSACYDTKAESRIGCDVTCYEFDAMMDLPVVIPAERSEDGGEGR